MLHKPNLDSQNGFADSVRGRLRDTASFFLDRFTAIPRSRKMVAGVALLLAALAAAYFAWHGPWSAPPVQYVTAPVTRGDVVRTVTASGTVNPVLTIIVGTYVSGVIEDVKCDFNTRVSKGQLCAKIDPRPYQTIVDQDRAQLAAARAQLDKDKAAMAYAKASLDRSATLVTRNVVSKDTFDQAKATFDQAQAQVHLDEATISQRQAELSAAEVNLGYTNIVSPVEGTVVSRNVTIGQTVAASFQTPTLFLIAADLTEMQVDTNVSESDIGAIIVGDRALFSVESFPNHPFEGVVTQVRQAPQTIQNVVTYDVVIAVKNPEFKLKPGMTATTKIVLERRDKVLRIPSQAQRYSPAGAAATTTPLNVGGRPNQTNSVWILRDGEPVRVDIKAGLDDDTFAELREGDLKEGDLVIVSERTASSAGTYRPRF